MNRIQTGGHFITELAHAAGQFRLIDDGDELLRGEEALWLEDAIVAALSFSDTA